jgi:mRNA-degrading endonuclease RelE of RelBE toxin-antitoxin system
MLTEYYPSFVRDFKKLDEKSAKLISDAIKEIQLANSMHEIKNVVDISSKKSYSIS